MMRIAISFLVALLLFVSPAHAGQWLTGSATNPTTDAVIVTTDRLAAATADFLVILRSSVLVTIAVERLNPSSTVVRQDSVQFVLAPGASPIILPLTMEFRQGDVVRVRVVSGVAGTVQAAIRFNSYCVLGLGCAH